MQVNLKKIKTILFASILLVQIISAVSAIAGGPVQYQPLAPVQLPQGGGVGVNGQDWGEGDPTVSTDNLNNYLVDMVRLLIGIAGALAFVEIIIGGITYMASEAVGGKENAKSRIKNALYGFLLAIGAYAILYTIDPNILSLNLFK